MENQFQKKMSEISDKKLIEILKTREEYIPEAIEAAELEFKKRNIPEEVFQQIQSEVIENIQRKETIKSENASKPLATYLKILFFLNPIPIGIIHLFLIAKYDMEGYDLKYKESIKSIKYGIIFYVSIFVLIEIFQ